MSYCLNNPIHFALKSTVQNLMYFTFFAVTLPERTDQYPNNTLTSIIRIPRKNKTLKRKVQKFK